LLALDLWQTWSHSNDNCGQDVLADGSKVQATFPNESQTSPPLWIE